jgi:hypothetical protein
MAISFSDDGPLFAGFFIGGLQVTEFKETEMRKMCRKCRSKLLTPTSNEREGFCCRGCYNAFYRKHCRVCEAEIEQPKRGERILCKRPKCRTLWDAKSGFGRYAPFGAESISEVPANQAVLTAPKTVEWRIIAGPALTPSQMHCATVPDGPDCKWEGGSYERIEAQNRRLLKAHFAKLGEKAVIQRQHMPVNIQGGYRPNYRVFKLNDESDAEQWKLPDPVIPGMGYDRQAMPEQQRRVNPTLPNDLSIPDFLLRPPEPLAMAA